MIFVIVDERKVGPTDSSDLFPPRHIRTYRRQKLRSALIAFLAKKLGRDCPPKNL